MTSDGKTTVFFTKNYGNIYIEKLRSFFTGEKLRSFLQGKTTVIFTAKTTVFFIKKYGLFY